MTDPIPFIGEYKVLRIAGGEHLLRPVEEGFFIDEPGQERRYAPVFIERPRQTRQQEPVPNKYAKAKDIMDLREIAIPYIPETLVKYGGRFQSVTKSITEVFKEEDAVKARTTKPLSEKGLAAIMLQMH